MVAAGEHKLAVGGREREREGEGEAQRDSSTSTPDCELNQGIKAEGSI
jgi:hypothetical protein